MVAKLMKQQHSIVYSMFQRSFGPLGMLHMATEQERYKLLGRFILDKEDIDGFMMLTSYEDAMRVLRCMSVKVPE